MIGTFSFTAENLGNVGVSIEYPNECPICHHHIYLNQVINHSYHRGRKELQLIFRCPNEECANFFISYNKFDENNKQVTFTRFQPINVRKDAFSDIISNLSSSFVSIYNQAVEAKELGLLQIAGPGFRKAFEFLIKDYAKSLSKPDEHKTIEQTFSGKVVSQFVKEPRIQKVAERALWLGNDETHYLRKWESHDLDDLIHLIQLSIYWIEMDKLSEKYASEMK